MSGLEYSDIEIVSDLDKRDMRSYHQIYDAIKRYGAMEEVLIFIFELAKLSKDREELDAKMVRLLHFIRQRKAQDVVERLKRDTYWDRSTDH